MSEAFSRTERLIGQPALSRLQNAHVAVFGLGGVGGHCAEALIRAGVGALTFIDGDSVQESNLNRQIIALRSTVGQNKAECMRVRALDICPDIQVTALPIFYGEATADEIDLSRFDYIADAIDSVADKTLLICNAKAAGRPIISSMGAGNKLNPAAFCVADLYETTVCPLARVMRAQLKRRGVEALKVVYSKEPPRPPVSSGCCEACDRAPASISFVPSAAGLVMAGEIVRELADL